MVVCIFDDIEQIVGWYILCNNIIHSTFRERDYFPVVLVRRLAVKAVSFLLPLMKSAAAAAVRKEAIRWPCFLFVWFSVSARFLVFVSLFWLPAACFPSSGRSSDFPMVSHSSIPWLVWRRVSVISRQDLCLKRVCCDIVFQIFCLTRWVMHSASW